MCPKEMTENDVDPVVDFFRRLSLEGVDDKYPGSRHTRRKKPVPPMQVENYGWDANGYIRLVNGKRVEFFPIGALSKAINRHPNSVRNWISKGYIPHAPYRLKSYTVGDREIPGRRLWTRNMIEALADILAERGLLNSARLEWSRYPDLPAEISAEFKRLFEENKSTGIEEEE